MAALSGKNGRVYAANLLVEDCEDTWNESDPVAGVAISTVAGVSGNAARATTTTVGAATLLMSEVISKDLSTYDALGFWIRSSVNTVDGDLEVQLDDTVACASPVETLSVPALTANEWRFCVVRFATPASLTTLISVGLYQSADLADGTFDIDAVYALAETDGMKNWSIDYTADTVEVTDFQSDGVAEYIPTITRWSGSFDGDKDGAPLSIGSEIYLGLGESKTETQVWGGAAILTGVSASTAFDGAVTYSYTLQGTGRLSVPTA